MSLDQVNYLKRDKCGMNEGNPDCSMHWVPRARTPDFESNTGVFDVLYCTKCKMGLTDPYPSEETSGYLYDTKTSGDFDVIQHGPVDQIKDMLGRRLLRSLSPFADPAQVGHVLDYSCGNARFASLASECFPNAQVDAVDYQKEPPAIFSSGKFSRLRYWDIETFRGQSQTYDLIILRHVLEHTHHPIDLVRFLGSRLTPEGILYIDVPNLDAGCARVFKNKWKGYYVPRHIFHYTKDSLHEIITQAGLEGNIMGGEIPIMGNMMAILFGWNKSNMWVQLGGAALHPVQLAIEKLHGSSTCINVKARRAAVVRG